MNFTTTEVLARAPEEVSMLDMIAAHPFLRGMSAEHIEELGAFAMLTEFQENQLIFEEGGIANRFYLLLEGRVALEAPIQDRGIIPIGTVAAGDVVGWSWLFAPHYWRFNARAVERTKAIFFYGTRLRERAEEDHELGYELITRTAAVVLERLQATRRRLVSFYETHPYLPLDRVPGQI